MIKPAIQQRVHQIKGMVMAAALNDEGLYQPPIKSVVEQILDHPRFEDYYQLINGMLGLVGTEFDTAIEKFLELNGQIRETVETNTNYRVGTDDFRAATRYFRSLIIR